MAMRPSRAPHTQANFASGVAHFHFLGHHTFCDKRTPIDLEAIFAGELQEI